MQLCEHPKQLPAWEPELENNWRGAIIESWVKSRSTGSLLHNHGATHGLCNRQGLFQPEFHGHNSLGHTCRKLPMQKIPVEPCLGHCGCRVLVTNHGLQRQWRNNRKNPTSSAGNDGKLWELAVALPALPDTSHSGVEENKQQGDLSQGCILPFPYPNPWEQRKPRADGH